MEAREVAERLAARVTTEYETTGRLPADVVASLREKQRRRWLAGDPVTLDELARPVREWAEKFRFRVDRGG